MVETEQKKKEGFIVDLEDIAYDEACPMSYWFHNKECNGGVVNRTRIVPEALMAETAKDIRLISSMEDISIDAIHDMINPVIHSMDTVDRNNTKYMELLVRRLGVAAAYALFMEPGIRNEFHLIDTDDTVVLDRDPLFLITHPTIFLKSKVTGLSYLRKVMFKPSNSMGLTWLTNQKYRMHRHLEGMAVEESMEEHVSFSQIVGIDEGYKSVIDRSNVHPYIYGYYNDRHGNWSCRQKPQSDGWEKVPVWEYPHGIVKWVKDVCGETTAKEVIKISTPFILNRELCEGWLSARTRREREIHEHQNKAEYNLFVRQSVFERNTNHCAVGTTDNNEVICPYISGCWNPTVVNRPLTEHMEFTRRIPLLLVEA